MGELTKKQGANDVGAKKQMATKPALTDVQLQEVRKAFTKADAERFGQPNSEELRLAMRDLGFDATNTEILKILAEANEEHGGIIGYPNFLKMITPRILSRK